jgi:hypothetical protein
MGWERRGNHYYYYRKHRDGDRVISEYWGRHHLINELIAEEMLTKTASEDIESDDLDEAAQALDDLYHLLNTATRGAYHAKGLHNHHGEWRKRRRSSDTGGGSRTII